MVSNAGPVHHSVINQPDTADVAQDTVPGQSDDSTAKPPAKWARGETDHSFLTEEEDNSSQQRDWPSTEQRTICSQPCLPMPAIDQTEF